MFLRVWAYLSDYSFSTCSVCDETVPSDAVAGSDEGEGVGVKELAVALSSGTGSGSEKGGGLGAAEPVEVFRSFGAGAGSGCAALIVYAGVEFHTGSGMSLTTSTR